MLTRHSWKAAGVVAALRFHPADSDVIVLEALSDATGSIGRDAAA
jgi:hypothetical protein